MYLLVEISIVDLHRYFFNDGVVHKHHCLAIITMESPIEFKNMICQMLKKYYNNNNNKEFILTTVQCSCFCTAF